MFADIGNASADMPLMLDTYTLGDVLGEGSYGTVYAIRHKQSKRRYAAKQFDLEETPKQTIDHEAQMLFKLQHQCVVKLHSIYHERYFSWLVMDLYRGGCLADGMWRHWNDKGMIPVAAIQNISKMMVQAVAWLHENSVFHRDIKADNFLLNRRDIENPKCRVFLSDFGTACCVSKPTTRLREKVGTQMYWAPEQFSRWRRYGRAVDIWALGVTIFGMVSKHFPFNNEKETLSAPFWCPGGLSGNDDGESFLQGLLERNEGSRLTAAQALEHPFLSSVTSAADTAEEGEEDNASFMSKGASIQHHGSLAVPEPPKWLSLLLTIKSDGGMTDEESVSFVRSLRSALADEALPTPFLLQKSLAVAEEEESPPQLLTLQIPSAATGAGPDGSALPPSAPKVPQDALMLGET